MSTAAKPNTFEEEVDESVLQDLYAWVDGIPLSRPKRNMARDFSDGVLVAEVVKHYFPAIVEIHNYAAANGTKQKMENWMVLNRKVFRKLQFELAEDIIRQIAQCRPFAIERVLLMLRTKIDRAIWDKEKSLAVAAGGPGAAAGDARYQNEKPEADQHKGLTPRKPNKLPPMGATAAAQPMQGAAIKGKPSDVNYSDTVARILFEEKSQECLAKEETIQILQAKIRRLEHLLHLKDIRIEDLGKKLDGIRPTGGSKR